MSQVLEDFEGIEEEFDEDFAEFGLDEDEGYKAFPVAPQLPVAEEDEFHLSDEENIMGVFGGQDYGEDIDEEIIGEEFDEGLDTRMDPSDWSRITHGRGLGTMMTQQERLQRDPRSISLGLVQNFLSDSSYENFSKAQKDKTIDFIESILKKQFVLLNAEVLTAAALYIVIYKSPRREDIEEFLNETDNLPFISNLDFLRYVRMLTTVS